MAFGGPRALSILGDFKHERAEATGVPGSFKDILVVTIPDMKKRSLFTAYVISRIECDWKLVNSDTSEIVGEGSTDQSRTKDLLPYTPPSVQSNTTGGNITLTLSARQRMDTPAITIKAGVMSSEQDA